MVGGLQVDVPQAGDLQVVFLLETGLHRQLSI